MVIGQKKKVNKARVRSYRILQSFPLLFFSAKCCTLAVKKDRLEKALFTRSRNQEFVKSTVRTRSETGNFYSARNSNPATLGSTKTQESP